jgi:hypothetical protein
LIEPRRLILRKGEVLLIVQDSTVLSPRPAAPGPTRESLIVSTSSSTLSNTNLSSETQNINTSHSKSDNKHASLPLIPSSIASALALPLLSTSSTTPRYIEYYYILFNDLLILTVHDDNKLKMKFSWSLVNAMASLKGPTDLNLLFVSQFVIDVFC